MYEELVPTTTTTTTTLPSNATDLIDFYYFDNTLNQPHTICIAERTVNTSWRIHECEDIWSGNASDVITIAGNGTAQFMFMVVDKRYEDEYNILRSYAILFIFVPLLIIGVLFLVGIIWLLSKLRKRK